MMDISLLLRVIGSALGFGVVHVLTGPDHLSALAALSVGKPLKTAFGLGVRWGTGHSFSLLIVAVIFFALHRSINFDDETYGFYTNLIVGLFMILLGAWYMIKACRERENYLREKEEKEAMELLIDSSAKCAKATSSETNEPNGMPVVDADIHLNCNKITDDNASENALFEAGNSSGRSKWMTQLVAFVAGFIHGVAGPGGVLGVLMALKLNDWFLSSLYLLLFFVSSIVAMGLYAILYGYGTQRLAICANNKPKCAFILKFMSAVLSLIVGVLWISLTFSGTLDDLFG